MLIDPFMDGLIIVTGQVSEFVYDGLDLDIAYQSKRISGVTWGNLLISMHNIYVSEFGWSRPFDLFAALFHSEHESIRVMGSGKIIVNDVTDFVTLASGLFRTSLSL
jgi:hypothetical protein